MKKSKVVCRDMVVQGKGNYLTASVWLMDGRPKRLRRIDNVKFDPNNRPVEVETSDAVYVLAEESQ